VTVARGEEVSRSVQTIITEINELHQQGINEVILTGVHLGGYGDDINSNLSDLIQAILDNTDIPRLRMGSLEPWELPADFFDLFDNPRLMPHLHLPLQSGSDTVLRRMARRCKTEEFTSIIKQARNKIKHFNITTDIIVGFPGETEQEWQDSFDFIKSIGFGHIHIFTYSSREGTKAATLPNQLENKIKKQRSKQLHQLAEQMKQQFIKQNINNQYPVLWEAQKQPLDDQYNLSFGYTPNYLRVACKVANNKSIENKIINAELKEIIDEHLLCSLTL
jgi:threonylcarbamoyladenosine tRNA methylthiotransferase MtaB